MKKLLFLLIATGGAIPAIAQEAKSGYHADSLLSRWVIDLNLLGGGVSQSFTTVNSSANYPNALDMNTGQLKYKNGYSFGADAQLGFFFGKKRHFGIGAGILYMQQHGDAILNNYQVEYQATDGQGNIYRQVVNGDDVREAVISTNINIPLVLKYKNRFSKHWGFAADAGALFNLQMNNAYTTNASFDYGAIYQLQTSGDGGTVSVYDNSPVPSANDWMITKAEFLKNNPGGNYQDYVNAKRALGFNVGEGLSPGARTGSTSYNQGSVGLLIQPSFSYYLSDHVALNFGVYYMLQPFKNNAQADYRLTDGMGTYSSVMNSVTTSINQSYGINVGVRFLFGKKHAPLIISSVYQSPPSKCGLCDGSIALNGLPPNKKVTVDYSLNGAASTSYSSDVQPDGKVTIAGLCAGNYTGIVATVKRQSANGTDVTLANPSTTISSENAVNPTLPGANDGAVVINGLSAGKPVTINYSLNNTARSTFTGIVNPDNSVTISGLYEGTYTGMVVSMNNCPVNGSDFTLVAPKPAPTPIPPAPVAVGIDISAPILFDFNKSVIHSDSYPELQEAAKQMKEDKAKTLTIDGYTDIIGTAAYNKALSIRRANAVKKSLTKMGISSRRLKTAGHGAKHPVANNNTAEGRQEDRRAVMTVHP